MNHSIVRLPQLLSKSNANWLYVIRARGNEYSLNLISFAYGQGKFFFKVIQIELSKVYLYIFETYQND